MVNYSFHPINYTLVVIKQRGAGHWQLALRNVSASLLWAIQLRIRREELSPTFAGDDRDQIKDVAYLVGEALARAAMALPDSVLKEAPLLENIGLHHPALPGLIWSFIDVPCAVRNWGNQSGHSV